MASKTFKPDTPQSTELKWFNYRQNNSGGSIVKDDDVSITVVVQAASLKEANRIAVDRAGVYFDGVRKGYDCSCCGDRWHESWDEDGMDSLSVMTWSSLTGKYRHTVYDTIEDWAEARAQAETWVKPGESAVILYYADGTKTVYYKD